MKKVLLVILIQAIAYWIVCFFGWAFVLELQFDVWKLIPAGIVSSVVHLSFNGFAGMVVKDKDK